jgi:hypothetical protein
MSQSQAEPKTRPAIAFTDFPDRRQAHARTGAIRARASARQSCDCARDGECATRGARRGDRSNREGARLVLAGRPGADGAHFPEARIGEACHWRAVRSQWLITCAAHSLAACARIARTGATAALLAPVFKTESHAGAETLGPVRLLLIAGQSPVPVYALGGIDQVTARRLQDADLAGLAAVSALSC